MLNERRPLQALLDRLRAERRVWVRIAANHPLDDWQLSLLEITLVAPPPGWRRKSWIYERAQFVAAAPSGATVAHWLERGRVRMKPIALAITVADSHVQVERRPSGWIGIFQPLSWPSVEWKVHVQDVQNRQMLNDELVAPHAPAFLSFDLAAEAFFGVTSSPGGRSFSGCECVIREQDLRARIDSVRVRSTEVRVNVSGERVGGTLLTLGGRDGQTKRLRRTSAEVRFPRAGGIPPGSWLALHRGHELLDRRGLDPARGGLADVELEVDPVTEIEVLISGGEIATTEFKRQLPSDDRASIITAMKTVAAFANGNGGTLLFGVENDGTVIGLDGGEVRRAVDRLTLLIRDWVKPLVEFHPTVAEVDGRPVVLVRVEPGVDTPYGVGTSERRVDYFVRRGGTTFPATPADVRAFVRARLPSTEQQRYLPR
jgi:Putative DNA-binding domain